MINDLLRALEELGDPIQKVEVHTNEATFEPVLRLMFLTVVGEHRYISVGLKSNLMNDRDYLCGIYDSILDNIQEEFNKENKDENEELNATPNVSSPVGLKRLSGHERYPVNGYTTAVHRWHDRDNNYQRELLGHSFLGDLSS